MNYLENVLKDMNVKLDDDKECTRIELPRELERMVTEYLLGNDFYRNHIVEARDSGFTLVFDVGTTDGISQKAMVVSYERDKIVMEWGTVGKESVVNGRLRVEV